MIAERVLVSLHGLVVEDVPFTVVRLSDDASMADAQTVARRVRWACRGCGRERMTFVHAGGRPMTAAEIARDLGAVGVRVCCEEYSGPRDTRAFYGLDVVACGLCPATCVLSQHAEWRIGYEHGRRDVLLAMLATTYTERVRAIRRLPEADRDFVPMLPVAPPNEAWLLWDQAR